ncbi:MAG: hypothetical protein VKK80_01870 [Prochlorothrix sp.]|nr:hypothetical protein [Prochlorothrix sp.]
MATAAPGSTPLSVPPSVPTPPPAEPEPILCPHCRRTATNGLKCKGICVADSDY